MKAAGVAVVSEWLQNCLDKSRDEVFALRLEVQKLQLAIRLHRQDGRECQCYPSWPDYVDESLAKDSPIVRGTAEE